MGASFIIIYIKVIISKIAGKSIYYKILIILNIVNKVYIDYSY
jgi:hypothetical protein